MDQKTSNLIEECFRDPRDKCAWERLAEHAGIASLLLPTPAQMIRKLEFTGTTEEINDALNSIRDAKRELSDAEDSIAALLPKA